MATITGSKKEVALIIEMLNSAYEIEACTYETVNMEKNQFGVTGVFNKEYMDFMVEIKYK